MALPFSAEHFYEVFDAYNEAVWPAQMFLLAVAVTAFALVFRPRPWSGVVIAGSLGFLWVWLALAYHLAFFSRINPWPLCFRAHHSRAHWYSFGRALFGASFAFRGIEAHGQLPAWLWWCSHSLCIPSGLGTPGTPTRTCQRLAFLAQLPYIRSVCWRSSYQAIREASSLCRYCGASSVVRLHSCSGCLKTLPCSLQVRLAWCCWPGRRLQFRSGSLCHELAGKWFSVMR